MHWGLVRWRNNRRALDKCAGHQYVRGRFAGWSTDGQVEGCSAHLLVVEAVRAQLKAGDDAYQRVIHTDDAHVVGDTPAGVAQGTDDAYGHGIVCGIDGRASCVFCQNGTHPVAAVGGPVAKEGLGNGQPVLLQGLLPTQAALDVGGGVGPATRIANLAMALGYQMLDDGRRARKLVVADRWAPGMRLGADDDRVDCRRGKARLAANAAALTCIPQEIASFAYDLKRDVRRRVKRSLFPCCRSSDMVAFGMPEIALFI